MLPSPSSPDDPPRVAFAVPRAVGPAVARNRVRRRIRAHLVERRRNSPELLPSGAWLFALRAGAAEADRSDLLTDVDACIDRLLVPSGPAR